MSHSKFINIVLELSVCCWTVFHHMVAVYNQTYSQWLHEWDYASIKVPPHKLLNYPECTFKSLFEFNESFFDFLSFKALTLTESTSALWEGDVHWRQERLSKEDLRAVPPWNCQHTFNPSEKKEASTDVSVYQLIKLQSYRELHSVYFDSSLPSSLMSAGKCKAWH